MIGLAGRLAAVAVAAALLAACAVRPPEPADGKPLHPVDPATVHDAVPRADPILAAGNSSPYRVNGRRYEVLATHVGYRDTGVASWYGRKFHGRNTANGEIFDAYEATAAHRTLPLPSYVRVTNLENNESLVVRVNDRGPFHSDRIIDMSYAAAVKLGFDRQGTAPVEVVAISVAGTEDLRNDPATAHWKSDYRYLQVGSFSRHSSATALREQLAPQLDAPVNISQFHRGEQPFYRVRVGPVEDRARLLALKQQLRSLGFEQVKPMPR